MQYTRAGKAGWYAKHFIK